MEDISSQAVLHIADIESLAPEEVIVLLKFGTVFLWRLGLMNKFYQLPYTILRYANVYGPRQVAKGEGGAVAIFPDQKGQTLKFFGDGEQTRDFIYVKEIVEANLKAIDRGSGETIHASTARKTSINQLINSLKQIHGSPLEDRLS